MREAADTYSRVHAMGTWSVFGVGVALALGALALILSRIDRLFRARNLFERFVLVVLIVCALIAILTTIGIIFSVVTETWRFFFDPEHQGQADRHAVPVRHRLEPAGGHARRPGRHRRPPTGSCRCWSARC